MELSEREPVRPGVPVHSGPEPPRTLQQRVFSDRPLGYPNPLVWLRSGILRDWRGPVGALVATWLYLPLAIFFAAYVAVAFGVGGLIFGGTGLDDLVPDQLRGAPLAGPMIDSFLSRSGGVLGGLVGAGVGLLGGFLFGLYLPWRGVVDDPASVAGAVAGIIVAAALVGVLYTMYRVVFERWLLHVSGARRLSRREAAFLTPILHDCARALDLPNVPRLLVDDRPGLNAYAYTRHVVLTTDLIEEFGYQPGPVAAVLSHELVHWRNGDPVTSAFVRGVALPLYLVHAAGSWLMRTFQHPVIRFFVWAVFWPIFVTVKYVVMPLQAADTRLAEYRADGGAVLAGHASGMRAVLSRRSAFEAGRTGWDEAVCATHPPSELRLERLETPGVQYQLGQEETDTAADAVGGPVVDRHTVLPPPGSLGSRRGWAIAGAVAAACFVLLGALAVVQWRFFTPQDAVEEYFGALERHDAKAALGRVSLEEAQPLAANDAFVGMVEADAYQPPTDVSVKKVSRAGDTATAEVEFRLGDTPHTAVLTLDRDRETTAGLFHGWRIRDGVSSFTVTATGPAVVVNGVTMSMPADSVPTIAALPGGYTVTLPDNPLVEGQPQTVYVGTGDAQSTAAVELGATVKASAGEQVTRLVNDHVNGCAARQEAAPENCPFAHFSSTVVGPVRWQVIRHPKVRIELDGSGRALVTTTEAGLVRASGRSSDFLGDTDPFSEEYPVRVSGSVLVAGNQLVYQAEG